MGEMVVCVKSLCRKKEGPNGRKTGCFRFIQKNAEKAEKDKRLRDAVSIFFILFGSVIVAVNLNTFVEQGKLVPAVSPDSPS